MIFTIRDNIIVTINPKINCEIVVVDNCSEEKSKISFILCQIYYNEDNNKLLLIRKLIFIFVANSF